jgi:hypothetical protein
MRSAGPGIGGVTHRLADLEAVLTPLVPALEQLHTAQIEQRRQVVAGDLSAMVTVNTAIQDTSARIALLEERRQSIQAELEAELGVQGLRAVLMAAAVAPPDRARLGQLLVQVTRLVREIREQGRRNATLLDAAIGAAQRTRQVLHRLSGADNTYDPVKARRQQAAMRARASLTAMTHPVQAGRLPGQPGEDEAASAPGALGKEAS